MTEKTVCLKDLFFSLLLDRGCEVAFKAYEVLKGYVYLIGLALR